MNEEWKKKNKMLLEQHDIKKMTVEALEKHLIDLNKDRCNETKKTQKKIVKLTTKNNKMKKWLENDAETIYKLQDDPAKMKSSCEKHL